MKKLNSQLYVLLLLVIGFSCEEVEFRQPTDTDMSVPPNVSEILTESLPGAVRVGYTIPKDPNIAYVQARYNLASGRERTVNASVYANSLLLEGFGDTLEHEVQLYTVTKSNVVSEVQIIRVRALEASIWKVYRSIEFIDFFGGYNLSLENEDQTLVTVFVMERNDFGEFEVNNLRSFSTGLPNITSKVRGLDTIAYEFKYFVMDRWDNSTDTTLVEVNPLFETEIPKNRFRAFRLPGDAPQVTNGAALEYAWDNRLLWPYTSFTNQTSGGTGPHMITIDMGAEAKLSRLWIMAYPEFWWDAANIQWYYLSTMKRFEVYGSVAPNPNGTLDESWSLLGSFEVVKPSGSPYGQDTPEDRLIAERGFDFELDINAPKARYIRIRCLENFGGGTAQSINELSVFGDPR